MTFGNILSNLTSSGYSFRIRGFINIEGGNASITSQLYEWCDCTSMEPGPKSDTCKSCGKKPGSHVAVPAGDGDGVYVVFEIYSTSAPKSNVGALVIFDSGYELANKVRSDIEREAVPDFPSSLVSKNDPYLPISLGQLKNNGTVYFSDDGSGINSSNAIVDVQNLSSSTLQAFTFVQMVEPSAKGWANRWSSVAGMPSSESEIAAQQVQGKAMFETLGRGGEYSLPSFVPRILLVIDEAVVATMDFSDQLPTPDWGLVGIQFASTMCTSHIQPMNTSTIWMNALLAREWDRSAPSEVSNEEAKALLFDVWTWAYQGAYLGDSDCENLISQNRYKATPEEISNLLRRRGMYQEADRVLTSGTISNSSESNGGLTKKGKGLPVENSLTTLAKYCSDCGSEYLSAEAKFCSSCGGSRK